MSSISINTIDNSIDGSISPQSRQSQHPMKLKLRISTGLKRQPSKLQSIERGDAFQGKFNNNTVQKQSGKFNAFLESQNNYNVALKNSDSKSKFSSEFDVKKPPPSGSKTRFIKVNKAKFAEFLKNNSQ